MCQEQRGIPGTVLLFVNILLRFAFFCIFVFFSPILKSISYRKDFQLKRLKETEMKKTSNCCLALILLLSLSLSQPVYASILSPGLEIIASDKAMIKTGTSSAGVKFTLSDFENASSLQKVKTVTLRSLPSPESGVLYLDDVPVAVNQSISGENIDCLKFVPAENAIGTSFHFSVNSGLTQECTIRIDDAVNFAPTVLIADKDVAAWTQKDITCFGTLAALDPEGDTLLYEVVEYPKKGLLILTDSSHGDFRYTPYVGCSGTDSFTYRVRDSFGNYSDAAEASVYISRQNGSLVFSDMDEHWAHSAAIEMASDGIMQYETQDGTPVFSPDSNVSREEFLVMVMHLLGVDDPGECKATSFADDADIQTKNKAYVQAACNAGIIRGRSVDGVIRFCPKEPITRAEAAVMLNNILGADVPVNASSFSDSESIPAWAKNALYALNGVGILRGTGSGSMAPFSTLTKAQTAQILFNLKQYLG